MFRYMFLTFLSFFDNPFPLFQSVVLDRLALYLDSDITPWNMDKPWEDLLPFEWVQVFRFGTKDGKPADCLIKSHTYILQPVTGNAKYSKLQSNESINSGQPLQKAAVNLDDVTLCLSRVFLIFPSCHPYILREIDFK
ncbi:hypothetical protein JRO89_XS13G0070700 [Xanthoceras sorbifolium]|uniref:Uncharacterized protein n=1 Tax=Xanthoceras sorbifolium TaxID=99658 RepID=A0ABQ8H741_9ROSI|nr:hypothetical protein JRO89_XS13G0070700 [Xanthoceras sorbifolium]